MWNIPAVLINCIVLIVVIMTQSRENQHKFPFTYIFYGRIIEWSTKDFKAKKDVSVLH